MLQQFHLPRVLSQEGKQLSPLFYQFQYCLNGVLLFLQFFDELMALDGDTGANHIVTNHADAVLRLDLSDPGILLDIDTQADLEKYKSLT